MATKLEKPVTRAYEREGGFGTGRDSKRPLLVTLSPAGFITFRLKGTRQEYDLDFGSAFTIAVRRWADKKNAEVKREREMRRQGLA